MDDPKAIYAAKREALVKAQDLLDGLAIGLCCVADSVERWDQILLPEETKELNALQDLGYSNPIQINLKDWITNEAFFDALRSWRSVRALAQEAYEVLTDFEDVEPLPESPRNAPRSDAIILRLDHDHAARRDCERWVVAGLAIGLSNPPLGAMRASVVRLCANYACRCVFLLRETSSPSRAPAKVLELSRKIARAPDYSPGPSD